MVQDHTQTCSFLEGLDFILRTVIPSWEGQCPVRLLFGSWEPGWELLRKAAAVVQVSVDGGTTGVGQWHWERGGI